MLKTADSSTFDVSGLHAKLDRKRNVESHNSSVQEKFLIRFHDSIDVLNRHASSLVAEQQKFSTSLVNNVGKSVAVSCAYSLLILLNLLLRGPLQYGTLQSLLLCGVEEH